MAVFNNMAITNKGMALYTKIQAGYELKFTKMRVGSGKYDGDPIDLLDLVDGKLDVEIVKVSPNPSQKIALINGIVNNSSLDTALYICELGLYAEDPDEGEILYGYTSAGEYGDYYSPISNGPFSWSYQVAAAIGNASNIHITMAESSYDYSLVNTNTNLTIINGATQYDINQQIDTLLNESRCENAQGTATEIQLTINSFYNGLIKNFWASENSNNEYVTINGKPCYKPNTTTPPNFIKGKPYTVIYNKTAVTGGCFFIKASSEGTAKPNQVLALVPFSNEDDTGILGTMPNRSGSGIGSTESNAFTISKDLCSGVATNEYVGAFDLKFPEGYYDGITRNRVHIPNLLPTNILGGVKVGWEGNYIEGNIPNHEGITDIVSQTVYNEILYTRIPSGAYVNNSSSGYPEVKTSIPNLISTLNGADNSVKNNVINGLGGLVCKIDSIQFNYSGNTSSGSINFSITGLPFTPKIVLCKSYKSGESNPRITFATFVNPDFSNVYKSGDTFHNLQVATTGYNNALNSASNYGISDENVSFFYGGISSRISFMNRSNGTYIIEYVAIG